MAVKKQLSKSESMYRKKLISEYHLNRQWQLRMDYWAFRVEYWFCKTPYKNIYQKCKYFKKLSKEDVKQKYSNYIIYPKDDKCFLPTESYAAINLIYKNEAKDWTISIVMSGDKNGND